MLRDKINEAITSRKPFSEDLSNRWGFGVALVVNIIQWVILYFKVGTTSSSLLLSYNVIFGSKLIAPGFYVYWLPFISLAFLIFNLIVASSFYKREKLPSYFLAFASIAVQLVFLVAVIVLITINE
jgi:hypothetical protein